MERVHTEPVPPFLNILITGCLKTVFNVFKCLKNVFKYPDHRMFKNGGTSFDGHGCGKGARVPRRDKQRKVREERASRINSHGSLSLCALAL